MSENQNIGTLVDPLANVKERLHNTARHNNAKVAKLIDKMEKQAQKGNTFLKINSKSVKESEYSILTQLGFSIISAPEKDSEGKVVKEDFIILW